MSEVWKKKRRRFGKKAAEIERTFKSRIDFLECRRLPSDDDDGAERPKSDCSARVRRSVTCVRIYEIRANLGMPRLGRGERRRQRRRWRRQVGRVSHGQILNRTKSTSVIDRWHARAGRASPVSQCLTYLFEDAADVRGDEEDRDAVARHSRSRDDDRGVVLESTVVSVWIGARLSAPATVVVRATMTTIYAAATSEARIRYAPQPVSTPAPHYTPHWSRHDE